MSIPRMQLESSVSANYIDVMSVIRGMDSQSAITYLTKITMALRRSREDH
ncbi:MAG: hypothetical protein ACLTDF_10330 [Coprococcus sp.]